MLKEGPEHRRAMYSSTVSPMKQPWIVIVCAAFIVVTLAIALPNFLFGLVQPFVGALAGKHAAGPVVWLSNFAIMCGFG